MKLTNEKCLELLRAVDATARKRDGLIYGLPLHIEEERPRLIRAMRKWAHSLEGKP